MGFRPSGREDDQGDDEAGALPRREGPLSASVGLGHEIVGLSLYSSRQDAGYGLGSIEDLTLAQARNEVERLWVVVREGRNPIEERRELHAVHDAPKIVTFADALDEYMKSGRIEDFRSDKHRKQWRASLELHTGSKSG